MMFYLLDIMQGYEQVWLDGIVRNYEDDETSSHTDKSVIQNGQGYLKIVGPLYKETYDAITGVVSQWDREGVERIVFDIDSPGGIASGCGDCASVIGSLRADTVTRVDSMAASAAYWLASATDSIQVTNDAIVGSVGTVVAHVDFSKMLENIGAKVTFITAGEGKVDGNSLEPLSEAGLNKYQKVVNEHYSNFSSGVAKNRGVTKEQVTDKWGAHIYTGREAIRNGMADENIKRASNGRTRVKHRLSPRK